ncbi:MAG TPA: right-handed parallel beta-helix repeat-containing protein [Pyrinomonadaceae bacterium]|jgi:hypothetical protein
MNNLPREKLREIIARHGRALLEDPRRCEGLLRDYCGQYRREVSVLVMALEERVPIDLLSAPANAPREVLLARLAARLCDHLALAEPAAKWAVASWAFALGLASKEELEVNEQGVAAKAVAATPVIPTPATEPPVPVPTSSVASIIISGEGDGQYTSIVDALEAATPGARLVVRPGLYNESVIIDKPVEIVGDGPVEDIVIRGVASSCIQMRTDSASVTGLTLRGRGGRSGGTTFFAVDVPRGKLLLDNCDVTSDTLSAVTVHGATSEATIRRCRIHDGADSGIYFFGGSTGIIEECEVFRNENVGVAITRDGRTIIRRCKIHSGRNAGLVVWDNARAVVESCDVYSNRLAGVGVSDGGKLNMKGCSIYEGENSGLFIHKGGDAVIDGCDLFGHSESEIAVTTRGNLVARDSKIHQGNSFGLFVREGGKALMERCMIKSNAESGVAIGTGAVAALRGCHVNDNGQVAVKVSEGGAVSVEDSDLSGNLLGPWDVEDGAFVEAERTREV